MSIEFIHQNIVHLRDAPGATSQFRTMTFLVKAWCVSIHRSEAVWQTEQSVIGENACLIETFGAKLTSVRTCRRQRHVTKTCRCFAISATRSSNLASQASFSDCRNCSDLRIIPNQPEPKGVCTVVSRSLLASLLQRFPWVRANVDLSHSVRRFLIRLSRVPLHCQLQL